MFRLALVSTLFLFQVPFQGFALDQVISFRNREVRMATYRAPRRSGRSTTIGRSRRGRPPIMAPRRLPPTRLVSPPPRTVTPEARERRSFWNQTSMVDQLATPEGDVEEQSSSSILVNPYNDEDVQEREQNEDVAPGPLTETEDSDELNEPQPTRRLPVRIGPTPRGPVRVERPWELAIFFAENDAVQPVQPAQQVNLGTIPTRRSVKRIDDQMYDRLAALRPQGVGVLKARRQGSQNWDSQGLVFVGGPEDRDCERPVLITDYNGTIDGSDRCTRESLEGLLEDFPGMSFFIVSTMGASARAPSYVRSSNRFLTLGRTNMASSSGPREKAARVMEALWDSGACLIGFAGDTPTTDGSAANFLNIPYYAVNQTDRPIYRSEEIEETICVRPLPQTYRPQSGSCRRGYRQEEEIQCRREGSRPTWSRRSYSRLGCLYGRGEPTGETRTNCIRRYDGPTEVTQPPGSQNSCSSGFTLETRTRTERQQIGTQIPVDVREYSQGSAATHNWCELRTFINNTFEPANSTPVTP